MRLSHTAASGAPSAHGDLEDGHRRSKPAFATRVFPDFQKITLAKPYGSPGSRARAGLEQPPGRDQPQVILPPGWGRGRGRRNPPFSPNPGGTLPIPRPRGFPAEICSSAGAPHLSTLTGMGLHAPGRDVSCSTRPALPSLHPLQTPGSIQAGAEATADLTRVPAAPQRGKRFVRGFCKPESDHLPPSQAKRATKPPERQLSSGCPRRRGSSRAPHRCSGSWSIPGAPAELMACGIWDDPEHLQGCS